MTAMPSRRRGARRRSAARRTRASSVWWLATAAARGRARRRAGDADGAGRADVDEVEAALGERLQRGGHARDADAQAGEPAAARGRNRREPAVDVGVGAEHLDVEARHAARADLLDHARHAVRGADAVDEDRHARALFARGGGGRACAVSFARNVLAAAYGITGTQLVNSASAAWPSSAEPATSAPAPSCGRPAASPERRRRSRPRSRSRRRRAASARARGTRGGGARRG